MSHLDIPERVSEAPESSYSRNTSLSNRNISDEIKPEEPVLQETLEVDPQIIADSDAMLTKVRNFLEARQSLESDHSLPTQISAWGELVREPSMRSVYDSETA